MRSLLLVIIAIVFYGCTSTSEIAIQSIPKKAKVYNAQTEEFIGETPIVIKHKFDNNPYSPKCELLPPFAVIWVDGSHIIDEDEKLVCPDKKYVVTLTQNTFSKPKRYKLVEPKEEWETHFYLGVNYTATLFTINTVGTQSSKNDEYTHNRNYKLGFISDKNNRLEFDYLDIDESDYSFAVFSLNTVVPFYDDKITPFFKLGLGSYSYSSNDESYGNLIYNLGLGFLFPVTEDIEFETDFTRVRSFDYVNLAKRGKFGDGLDPLDSEVKNYNLSMGVKYKF